MFVWIHEYSKAVYVKRQLDLTLESESRALTLRTGLNMRFTVTFNYKPTHYYMLNLLCWFISICRDVDYLHCLVILLWISMKLPWLGEFTPHVHCHVAFLQWKWTGTVQLQSCAKSTTQVIHETVCTFFGELPTVWEWRLLHFHSEIFCLYSFHWFMTVKARACSLWH